MITWNENDLIFLLGAGASVDAGLPTVAKLTQDLRKNLPTLSDSYGTARPEFGELCDFIARIDPIVEGNYERFFEWVRLLLDVQKEPFRKIITARISDSLIEAAAHLTSVVGGEVARILESKRPSPDYLGRLADFLPEKGRLKVFTLNFDCCLEDACQAAGVTLTTGFDPIKRKWKPSLFQSKSKGMNLYKLHGSLRWNGTRDSRLSGDRFQYKYVPVELRAEELCNLPTYMEVSPRGWLILGPRDKIQSDDPFLTLFYEFHRSVGKAKVCIVIGYGYQDPHINTVLDQGIDTGVSIIDVNPGGPAGRYLASGLYHHLPFSTKNALTNESIKLKTQELKL
ncbi:MAG: SIR2 family protein [Thermodesulfobacteriota bacterium]|jgi:hypothetical protein